MSFAYPLAENAALYDQGQVEEYISTLFRNVDWNEGEVISLLGIGEKGTPQDGSNGKPPFRERQIIPPKFMGLSHKHLKRWAGAHVAGFIVPAVLFNKALEAGDVTLDKVAALTAIILDLDSGDTDAKLAYVTAALGKPSMVVASGGTTEHGTRKLHVYWLFDEPCEDVERVAAVRKELAHKVGGDASFGRATQVIRVAGSVHAKNGKPSVCKIIDRSPLEYSFEDLAEIVEGMLQMPGVEPPAASEVHLPVMTTGGMMDFTPRMDTATAALHRDIHEGGEDLTRWSEFNKVAGFQISEARAGRISLDAAYHAANGWMLQHMVPPWPQARFDSEFQAVLKVDITRHGPFPATLIGQQQAVMQMQATTAITPTPASFPFAQAIPPRPWLFGRWLMRGKVTAMIAPGGIGKSSLVTAMSLSMTSDREFLGKTIYGGPLRVWSWNLEDDGDSMARQRVAAAAYHRVSEGDVVDRLFVDSGPDGAGLCTAVEDRHGFTIIEPVMENVTRAIREQQIDVLFVDPFVSSHQVNENDNNKVDAVAKRWARVAVETQCAIVLVHHSRKLDGEAVTADSARGAGALINAARIVIVLNRMSAEQAEGWGLEPSTHRRYFSVADDKHNLAPAETADWFELVSVDLQNGNDIHDSDNVGVVKRWEPPRAMDGVDLDHLFQCQRVFNSGDYFYDATSKPWAGEVVANILKLDVVADKVRIKSVLKTWMGNGSLKIEMRQNSNRKLRQAVAVARWASDPHGANALVHDTLNSTMAADNG